MCVCVRVCVRKESAACPVLISSLQTIAGQVGSDILGTFIPSS